jgi:hypothetical protein
MITRRCAPVGSHLTRFSRRSLRLALQSKAGEGYYILHLIKKSHFQVSHLKITLYHSIFPVSSYNPAHPDQYNFHPARAFRSFRCGGSL